jgi:hypothetical protein
LKLRDLEGARINWDLVGKIVAAIAGAVGLVLPALWLLANRRETSRLLGDLALLDKLDRDAP